MNFESERKLREIISTEIGGLRLIGGTIHFTSWDEVDASLLKLLLEKMIISRGEVFMAIAARLRAIGREVFNQCKNIHAEKVYPDHAYSSQALAYAIAAGEFTAEEVRGIEFDHEEILDSFLAEYSCDLKLLVFKQLCGEEKQN